MSSDGNLYAQLATLVSAGTPHVLCTVVRTAGSTPRKAGAKLVVTATGTIGTIGGGRVEHEATEEARRLLDEGARARPTTRRLHLTHDLAMCCGGEVEIFFEPYLPRAVLLLCGGGHIAHALAPMAARAHFDVRVAEDLEELTGRERFPEAAGFIDGFDAADLATVPLAGAYVVVVTRDHAIDQKIVEQLLRDDVPVAFLGLIGSRRKAMMFRARLAHRGIDDERIERLVCPVGIDIGAETAEEIAVSILAQLIDVRHKRRALVTGIANVKHEGGIG